MRLPIWLKQALFGRERAVTYTNPGIVAYYWDGGAPQKHAVKEISATGAYLDANELWCVGTILTLTLQKEEEGEGEDGAAVPFVSLDCRVVRHAQGEAGIEFMLRRDEERKALKRFMRSAGIQRPGVSNRRRGGGADQGEALVEFALTVPLLFFLTVLAVDLGGWLYSWIEIGNAVRTAADYASLGSSSAGDPATATGSTLVNLINADLAKLPNRTTSNPSVSICENDGTNITALTGTCPSGANAPVADPEAPAYIAVTVDITFTYSPFFATFDVPSLGIGLPTIPSTIHKRAVMRILN